MKEIARFLHISENTVYGVATFYAQFKLTPLGKKVIRVCRGTACHVRGSGKVLSEMEKQLGIKAGETTEDMEYTLETVACIGACALAPTMTIDNETHGKMTTKKVAEVLGDRSKAQVIMTSVPYLSARVPAAYPANRSKLPKPYLKPSPNRA